MTSSNHWLKLETKKITGTQKTTAVLHSFVMFTSNARFVVSERTMIYNYWCLKRLISRYTGVWPSRRGGQYHISLTNKSWYWSIQTPIIVLLLFCASFCQALSTLTGDIMASLRGVGSSFIFLNLHKQKKNKTEIYEQKRHILDKCSTFIAPSSEDRSF